ncbi:MAG: hypothetical protein QM820_14770 [Minicystis sp.]
MTTLAQFDAATQERATAVFNMFTAQYRISPNLFRSEEIGAAVRGALDGAGTEEAAFSEQLWSWLLSILHRRMAEHAARGEDLPSKLPPQQYALLRKGLVARFGPLPEAALEVEPEEEPEAAVDARSPEEVVADMLRARVGGHAPIDPEVLAVLRG